jgi:hypothetical protein
MSRARLATVSRYLPKHLPGPGRSQRWMTFLRNHKDAYYDAKRVHTRLGDSPDGRPIETRPSPTARVVALPRVGGPHHRYVWAEAAQSTLGFTPRRRSDRRADPDNRHPISAWLASGAYTCVCDDRPFGPVGGDGAPAAPIIPAAIRVGDRAADPSGSRRC